VRVRVRRSRARARAAAACAAGACAVARRERVRARREEVREWRDGAAARRMARASVESSRYVVYTSLRFQTSSRLGACVHRRPPPAGSKLRPEVGTSSGPDTSTICVFVLHTTSVGSGSPHSPARCSPLREKASAVNSRVFNASSVGRSSTMVCSMSGWLNTKTRGSRVRSVKAKSFAFGQAATTEMPCGLLPACQTASSSVSEAQGANLSFCPTTLTVASWFWKTSVGTERPRPISGESVGAAAMTDAAAVAQRLSGPGVTGTPASPTDGAGPFFPGSAIFPGPAGTAPSMARGQKTSYWPRKPISAPTLTNSPKRVTGHTNALSAQCG
jgi:hypothetical protein